MTDRDKMRILVVFVVIITCAPALYKLALDEEWYLFIIAATTVAAFVLQWEISDDGDNDNESSD